MDRLTDVSDEVLASAAGRGDRAAFEVILERHYDRIYRVAYRFLGCAADAEDVAQDIAFRLVEKIGRFSEKSRFSTWLYTVTVNACRDHVRKRQAAGRLEGQSVELSELRAADWADSDEKTRWLYQALNELDPALRETALLVLAEDLTHRDAASILGVSEGTVSWRLHEVKKRLRTLVGQ